MKRYFVDAKYICLSSANFGIGINYKQYDLGFRIETWGVRIMLIWWHICWHKKEKE